MSADKDKVTSNKAGSTRTTNREYVKREHGKNDVPSEPAENTGAVSPTKEDLENPEQRHDKPASD